MKLSVTKVCSSDHFRRRNVAFVVVVVLAISLTLKCDVSFVRKLSNTTTHAHIRGTNLTHERKAGEYQLKVATDRNRPESVAIVVVTDANAAKVGWIKSRLSHFKCYALSHKYTFIHHTLDARSYTGVSFYTARWQALLDNYWGKYDWIFAHDTDSVYPDFSLSLDKFISRRESAPAIQVLARGTEIGANALLFRANNSAFSRQFMSRLVALGHRSPRPSANSNYDVRDIMMVTLELIYPELAELCAKFEEFFEFAKCFSPAIERIPLFPSVRIPLKIHLPMSGFVQQFESPQSEYGLLHGACWPGHLLMSGNGVKEHAPYPRDNGRECARDETMDRDCRWLSYDEQLDAANKCCLTEAYVCRDHHSACERVHLKDGMCDRSTCKVGWPILWAAGGEVADPALPLCLEPYIAMKRRGMEWNSSAYVGKFSGQLSYRREGSVNSFLPIIR